MLQIIENKQENVPFEAPFTVMFHGSRLILGGDDLFRAREGAAPSLSDLLAVISNVFLDAASQPGLLPLLPRVRRSGDRTRTRSLSHSENLFAEAPMARSALIAMAVNPNRRSPQAATTVITTMAEQRCCVAA